LTAGQVVESTATPKETAMNWKLVLVSALVLSSTPVYAAYYLVQKADKSCAVVQQKSAKDTAIGEISSFKSKEAANQAMMSAPECKP
jgi:hypothetical protein